MSPRNMENLASCADCGGTVSKYADACPHCGRVFNYREVVVIPGGGWAMTVFWGIILVWLIPLLFILLILVLLFVFGAGLAGIMKAFQQ